VARFKDTPKWKTREAYEKSKDKPKPVVKAIFLTCPVCGAQRGEPCSHPQRKRLAKAIRRRKRRVGNAQSTRWANVNVSFVCPICGGDHAKADHQRATGKAGKGKVPLPAVQPASHLGVSPPGLEPKHPRP
jgi:predicted RNA-binding Zn-ribbon protein involved in translation (DUF1610 family)